MHHQHSVRASGKEIRQSLVAFSFLPGHTIKPFLSLPYSGVIKCTQKWCAPPFLNHSVNPSHTCDWPLLPACYKRRVVNLQAVSWTRYTCAVETATPRSPVGGVAQLKNSHCEVCVRSLSFSHPWTILHYWIYGQIVSPELTEQQYKTTKNNR